MTIQTAFADSSAWIGSVGVALLLGAFLLNLFGWMKSDSRTYQALNAIGAGIACYASYLIDFSPFCGAGRNLEPCCCQCVYPQTKLVKTLGPTGAGTAETAV